MALTLKNQILWKDDSEAITLITWHSTYDIPFSANSVTNNPPPALWNASPYEDVSWSVTEQPWFPFSKQLQSVELTSLLVWIAFLCTQPCFSRKSILNRAELLESLTGSVCNVIVFRVLLLIPSNVSISPPEGQLGPVLQNAGHVEHFQYMSAQSSTYHTRFKTNPIWYV